MNIENINKAYLDDVLKGKITDNLHHLGICSNDRTLDLLSEIKAVVMAGSHHRIQRMAETWANKYLEKGSKSSVFKFPKDERFSIFYTNGAIFCSHGMGMPSMSIALQELMKLVYYVKKGDLKQIEKIFWCRVGTSGGLVEPGTIVLTTEGLSADFKPYRLFTLGKEHVFNTTYPTECIKDIIASNTDKTIHIIKGKTIGANDFYIEQNRLDGAIALCNENEKMEWLKKAEKLGVKNIEMETPMMAGLLNHWGFPNFAAICCVLVNRLNGDQVNVTHKDLDHYSINAEKTLWNYLGSI